MAVKEEPTCTEKDVEVPPLQEHDPLAIKPEPVSWQPSGSQEEAQPQGKSCQCSSLPQQLSSITAKESQGGLPLGGVDYLHPFHESS